MYTPVFHGGTLRIAIQRLSWLAKPLRSLYFWRANPTLKPI